MFFLGTCTYLDATQLMFFLGICTYLDATQLMFFLGTCTYLDATQLMFFLGICTYLDATQLMFFIICDALGCFDFFIICEVKNNVTTESARKSKVTGQARLTNAELRPVLLEFIQWSAALPSQLEFHVVWRSILERMEKKECSTDWNEADMAKYIREHILVETSGLLDAPWRCGLGCTPLGFSCYAPNAIEVSHRVIKGLLDPGYNKRPVTSIMSEIAEALDSRLQSGHYDNLQKEVREPWQELIQSTRKRSAVSLSTDPQDEANQTKAL